MIKIAKKITPQKCIPLIQQKFYEKYNTCGTKKKKFAEIQKVFHGEWALFLGNKQVGATAPKKTIYKRLRKLCKCDTGIKP